MSSLETAYAAELERRKQAGEVAWYAYEAMSLRLARLTSYRPDFLVMLADGALECHEVKGYVGRGSDNGMTKFKIAAELYPLRFVLVTRARKRDGGAWQVSEV